MVGAVWCIKSMEQQCSESHSIIATEKKMKIQVDANEWKGVLYMYPPYVSVLRT
jgi:hypothetical protein